MPADRPRTDGCIRTVLFDLDGTLLDTAPDLAWALNELRRRHDLPPLPFETIRPAVSHGGLALIRMGFGLTPDHPDTGPLRQELLGLYRDNIAIRTRPFPGIPELLGSLAAMGLKWGVVTNKPGWLTEPLMQAMALNPAPDCIVSGDTLHERKPHPAPMLHACRMTGSQPDQCVYVGDAQRDIEAGSRAGMHSLVALFGYIGEDEDPASWGADACLESPEEILDWIRALQAQ